MTINKIQDDLKKNEYGLRKNGSLHSAHVTVLMSMQMKCNLCICKLLNLLITGIYKEPRVRYYIKHDNITFVKWTKFTNYLIEYF